MEVTREAVDSKEFRAPTVDVVETDVEKQLEEKSGRGERCRRYVKTSGSIRVRWNSLSERPLMNVFNHDDKTDRRVYSMNGSEALPTSTHRNLIMNDQVRRNGNKLGTVQ